MYPDSSADSILLARQPIFDNDLSLFAYELLFRNNHVNQANIEEFDDDHATSQVINHTFLEFGINRVLGDKHDVLDVTRAFLAGEFPLPFKSKDIVLEILEDIEIDDEVIKAVKELSEQGFTIALDDFIYHENSKPLVDVANIIKIVLLTLSEQGLIDHVDILKQFDVKLLAEKVDTDAQYQQCKQLGFDLYQGYFFCKPTIIDDEPLPDNKAAALQIISELQRPNISITEVENLEKQDTSLSYKLLRCLNSAAFALPKHVNSLKQAVIYLGLDAIRSWAIIIAFSSVESPISGALLNTALIRAKIAEFLAEPVDCEPENAFILGLFSSVDAFFN